MNIRFKIFKYKIFNYLKTKNIKIYVNIYFYYFKINFLN